MYQIKFTNKMKRDVKRMKKRGKDISKLTSVLSALASGTNLPDSARNHQLSGNRTGFFECHIESDWLLIYRIEEDILILIATETGAHTTQLMRKFQQVLSSLTGCGGYFRRL